MSRIDKIVERHLEALDAAPEYKIPRPYTMIEQAKVLCVRCNYTKVIPRAGNTGKMCGSCESAYTGACLRRLQRLAESLKKGYYEGQRIMMAVSFTLERYPDVKWEQLYGALKSRFSSQKSLETQYRRWLKAQEAA